MRGVINHMKGRVKREVAKKLYGCVDHKLRYQNAIYFVRMIMERSAHLLMQTEVHVCFIDYVFTSI